MSLLIAKIYQMSTSEMGTVYNRLIYSFIMYLKLKLTNINKHFSLLVIHVS